MKRFLSFLDTMASVDPDTSAKATDIYRKLFEGVATDINVQQTIPGAASCVEPVNKAEYFDDETSADLDDVALPAADRDQIEIMKNPHPVGTLPAAGRTSLGISGHCVSPQNVSSDCSTAT